jgi:fibronectin-binding autotransporter adhesin
VTKVSAGTLSVGTIGNGGVSGNLGAAANAAANLVFDGGTLRYTGSTRSTDRNFTINAGKTATFDITTNNLTVSGASIATTGALTKTGGLSIGLGQTLQGSGQIDGNTTILGTHAPGNSPGLQTFNGNLGYATGAMLNWELAANKSTDTTGLRGTDFDGIDVIGAGVLSIQTGVISNLIFNAAGSAVDWNNAFWDSNHHWLVYDDVNLPTLTAAAIFDTLIVSQDSLGATLAGGTFSWNEVGNDVYLDFEVAAVPEPGTALFGLACVGVAALRRRRARITTAG